MTRNINSPPELAGVRDFQSSRGSLDRTPLDLVFLRRIQRRASQKLVGPRHEKELSFLSAEWSVEC